jgi:hypothetical protein
MLRALIALALLAPATALSATCPDGALTPTQAREDLELSIQAVETAMPNPFWRQTRQDWIRRKAAARALSAHATTEEQLFRALAPLLRGVGEGHLSVARSDGMNCRYRASASLFPLDLLWRDDGAFVTAGYGDASDVPVGTQLLAVDGQASVTLFSEMYRVSAHDGVNRTGVMRDKEGRGYAVARWWMRGNEPAYVVRLRLPDGRTVNRRLASVPFSTRPAPPDDPAPIATLTQVDATTFYLYVPTFSNRRYRAAGADYRATIQTIFDTLQARGAKNLILDLRDNGGGSEPNESVLFSYLVADPLRKYASVRSRPNHLVLTSLSGQKFEHDIYDAEELKTVRPEPDGMLSRINAPPEGLMTQWKRASPVFTGRLVVLAGGYTFSGGAELASMLRATDRGLFVGEEVGGTHGGNTSGYKWDITLPNSQIEIGIPLLAFRFVWPDQRPGHGTLPDCFVQPAVGQRRVEKDAAYAMALHVLSRPWTAPSPKACS